MAASLPGLTNSETLPVAAASLATTRPAVALEVWKMPPETVLLPFTLIVSVDVRLLTMAPGIFATFSVRVLELNDAVDPASPNMLLALTDVA